KPQQLAALPQAIPALPAPPPPPAAPNLEMRAIVPPDLAKPVPPKQARRDGRACLRPAARALLERIEAQFGPMQIISTCRPGARIAGSGRISKHATGEAIDFNAGKRKGEVVRWLIANHKTGGIMTYAGMSHIHVDIGYRFVSLNSGG
ncbi:MAG TPA: D-Ala-D-Ala carboxypeptidase family metallohydrolase, partial [Hyphomicrobiaceae bacterium]|nr:D-Ala-D-Ala carboxypeptidase family metallohydrolase [Hyphomicrobiaceae bacterium]